MSGRKVRRVHSYLTSGGVDMGPRCTSVSGRAIILQSEAVGNCKKAQNVEFRLGEFVQENPAFDPAALIEVRLVFDRTPAGVVVLDDWGFRGGHDVP